MHLFSMERNEIIAALDREIEQLDQARKLIADVPETIPRRRGRPKGAKTTKTAKPTAAKGGMTAETRAKISAAQKARWASTNN